MLSEYDELSSLEPGSEAGASATTAAATGAATARTGAALITAPRQSEDDGYVSMNGRRYVMCAEFITAAILTISLMLTASLQVFLVHRRLSRKRRHAAQQRRHIAADDGNGDSDGGVVRRRTATARHSGTILYSIHFISDK